METWKWGFGRWFSFSIWWFVGSMLIFRDVMTKFIIPNFFSCPNQLLVPSWLIAGSHLGKGLKSCYKYGPLLVATGDDIGCPYIMDSWKIKVGHWGYNPTSVGVIRPWHISVGARLVFEFLLGGECSKGMCVLRVAKPWAGIGVQMAFPMRGRKPRSCYNVDICHTSS